MLRTDRCTTQYRPLVLRLRYLLPTLDVAQSARETTNSNLPSRTASPMPGGLVAFRAVLPFADPAAAVAAVLSGSRPKSCAAAPARNSPTSRPTAARAQSSGAYLGRVLRGCACRGGGYGSGGMGLSTDRSSTTMGPVARPAPLHLNSQPAGPAKPPDSPDQWQAPP